ncbi:16S rRNA (guanine(527)-N(7))-methyltransferase RsmG [Schleiferia thermophila]|jgi:16S rRNA (guanine527-N7)-methyltransferase|uniref:Ribosomal RNA small subunit methyltransferase G n=1 Tax=Schleiferia thermophila TaxID=884107 RepID=A0A369A9S2_9FLAO|nr:16S rRNA (guanine(527)-N(7))-methyltransferase RsmG [Schleiferia thermophila]KFD39540.1 16S rRNA methyltransferase [Schleiferia thermophila str. Yellowstone]PMB33979.1 16S rRNA (guanine(527)-N(7))-methyltransferase RsmG [Fischerella thermalis CCMEE 5319]RCX05056.1 16S rRNA m(7)G-527 methyltransferase [Schleiferia thermophila]GCD79425.1 ribosomal RNA small subunit methyltransferase G [Schleiferia thermophila]
MELIRSYFEHFSEEQLAKFSALKPLYEYWNARINVISRKDMENFYVHHVLHSLAIVRFTSFFSGAKVLDVGTGGGFPGIPLAIALPEVEFHLVDSIGKKIKVVRAVAEALQLTNVMASQTRAETLKQQYNYVVSRAVTRLPIFSSWIKGKLEKNNPKGALPPAVLYLKGGDLEDELVPPVQPIEIVSLHSYFREAFFETKKLVVFRV